MEGVTFHDKDVHAQLDARFVESRLHMDGEDVVPPDLFRIHQRLQKELIGTRAVPHYAVLDPTTGEFLYRTHLNGTDVKKWREDFLHLFRSLPEHPGESAGTKAGD